MFGRWWTYPEIAALKRLAARGLKDAAIGRRLGRSRQSVACRRLRLGIVVTPRPTPARVAEVRRLARDGWYDAEIADRLGVSRGTVVRTRRLNGIAAGRFAPEPRCYHPDAA